MPQVPSDWIVNTTDATFEIDVFVQSQEKLVVVDFWAEWCQPCRMLAPILEQVADEAGGQFVLVKANTDETPQAATQFGVSSIPAVYAVLNGEAIDFFQGVLPAEAVKSWVDRLLKEAKIASAIRLAETSSAEAETQLRDILETSPNEATVSTALADLLLRQGRDEECRTIIDTLEERGFLEPEAEKVKAALDLKAKGGADVDAARAAADAAPDDFRLQLALAEALIGKQRYEDGFEICLSLVAKDRKATGEQARELMVEVFRVLPDDSELTSEYRRKLSMALY